MTEPVLTTLGLALRGGALAVGETPVAQACLSNRAQVILLARDAAENTADKTRRLAQRCQVPLAELPFDKAQVGAALGRRTCALLAVTEAGLAARLLSRLAQRDGERYGSIAARLEEKTGRNRRTPSRRSAAGAPPAEDANKAIRRWPH